MVSFQPEGKIVPACLLLEATSIKASPKPVSDLRKVVTSNIRAACSLSSVLGLLPPPSRPRGISAIVRVKDEETWLGACLRSAAETFDEIVVADNGSTDATPDILLALKKELGEQLIVLNRPHSDIRSLTNDLIDQTHFSWVIRWDADFVARSKGSDSMGNFRDWLMGLDQRRYFFVYPSMVELCGDLFHQRPNTAQRADCHCFTFSDKLRYVYNKDGLEAPLVPIWYQVLKYETPSFFHVDVKPAVRMFLSFLWKEYLVFPQRGRFPRFEDYVSHTLQRDWEGQTLAEAAGRWTRTHFRNLRPYDRPRYGEYPAILETDLADPRFRLLYKDGGIVGREEYDLKRDQ